MKLKIEYVPIESLKTYANNAKIHTAEQIEQIKKSIKEFGMNDPIAIWKNDEIIEGHGRLIACKELGMTEVPIVRLDDLTDGQRRAYALAHNKLTMNTDFDVDVLDLEIEDLGSIAPEIDMSDFGFDVGDVGVGGDVDVSAQDQTGFSYHEQYGVIVMCESEEQQEEIYNHLISEGYNCRVVAV